MRIMAILLVWSLFPVCSSSQMVRHEGQNSYCFRGVEWTFGGVAIGDSARRVDSLLGKPLRVELVKEVDDGGDYVNEKRHYKYFEVDIVRGNVDRVFTKSFRVMVPSEIKVGMTLHSVLAKLRISQETKPIKEGSLEFASCSLGANEEGLEMTDDAWLRLNFDKENILASIELSVNRP